VVAHDGRSREIPQLQVTDTLDALWALGAAARRRLQCPVVAVTGSSGKTTVKGLLSAALRAFSTAGSLNNHLGVPLSLAMTPRNARAAVYELGTNHPGEIAPLAGLVRPDVALVLNVHPAHRQNFPSMAAITEEKLSIHQGLRPGGDLVLEESLPTDRLPPGLKITRFGRSPGARVQLLALEERQARYRIGEREVRARVPGGGEHRALSLAAVLAVLDVLGRAPDPALTLDDSLIAAGRGREQEAGGITVIDDSYNANPESMKAALIGLQARSEPRRFAVLGEMLELGADAEQFHRALAEHTDGLTGVYCVGEGMRALYEALPPSRRVLWTAQADDALLEAVGSALAPGDVLLVKGSNRVFWARDFVARLIGQLASK
jgi:UDP-N-acetylmuramoyl-tripeptide--D-alanyl-D-alanine ligase